MYSLNLVQRDALCWYTPRERLPRDHRGRILLQEILLLHCTGDLGHEAEDLFNASLVVPLHKDGTGTALRPIAIPTTHRKAFAKLIVSNFKGPLQAAAGPRQHAAMCPQGTVKMAQKIQQHLRQVAGEAVYIRTDIRNAFNEVSRQAALQALERAHLELAPLHHAWLHRPTTAILPATVGRRQTIVTHLAFALVLADPLQKLQSLPACDVMAYADDTVLACPPAVAVEYLQAWRDSLAAVGLSVNPHKLQVWNPRDLLLPAAFREAYPEATVTRDGFKVCGLPLDQADQNDPQDFTPLGAGTFTEHFLEEAREATNRRLRILATFVQTMGPHTEALHVAPSDRTRQPTVPTCTLVPVL